MNEKEKIVMTEVLTVMKVYIVKLIDLNEAISDNEKYMYKMMLNGCLDRFCIIMDKPD